MDSAVAEYVRRGRERNFGADILASWERCTRAGLHPEEPKPPPLIGDADLRRRLDQRDEIVELFGFYLRRFAPLLDDLGACSFVCDGDGYILSRVGYGRTLSSFDRAQIREGANCGELAIGTNAPGLALVTREPVMVTADEHYARQFHTAFCVASPIVDPRQGLLGCVDITKFFDRNISEDLRRDLLKLAITVTDAIQAELSLRTLAPRRRPRPVAAPPARAPDEGPACPAPSPRPAAPPDRPCAGVAPLDASRGTFGDIVGRSPGLADVVRLARSYSAKDANVLIQGETGTGKELVARAIHNEGSRSARRFVAVNCAAIPLELAESELFGYERGAFTGARAEGQPGKFELAHQGTLFLDEIDSMPLPIQAKILRAVETKSVSRINGRREIPVDVRIIAAGNVSLAQEVLAGRFRKDLFYRLNVLRLAIPPLRELREDVPDLLDAFLGAFAVELGVPVKRLSDPARAALVAYGWPGNVRELRNCVEYLYNTVEGELVLRSHLPEEIAATGPPELAPAAGAAGSTAPAPAGRRLDAFERQALADTLRQCGGRAVEAAKALGISRSAMYRKLKKHGLV